MILPARDIQRLEFGPLSTPWKIELKLMQGTILIPHALHILMISAFGSVI